MRHAFSRQTLAIATVVLVAGTAWPGVGRAEQFVLFDVTFTFTKADADNSKPSKSHYYVTADKLNPNRPRDWTAPVDYRNGTVHIRTEIIEKPAGGEPTLWSLCYIPNKGIGQGYGCTGTDAYREPGVYEKDVPMTKFWHNESIVWSEGIKRMDLVIKDNSGGSGHAHKRKDSEKFFPTRVRFTMIQVSAGAKYNPALVPNLPPKAAAESRGPDGSVSSTLSLDQRQGGDCCGGVGHELADEGGGVALLVDRAARPRAVLPLVRPEPGEAPRDLAARR
jgi:hypothetical protein